MLKIRPIFAVFKQPSLYGLIYRYKRVFYSIILMYDVCICGKYVNSAIELFCLNIVRPGNL